MIHAGTSADGKPNDTIKIKGGCIEGLDWAGGTHIFTRSAVVPIPEGAKQYETVEGGLSHT